MEGEEAVEPMIHMMSPQGDKWRMCLSFIGKWIAGIISAVVTALITGAFIFAWQSNDRLAKLDGIPDQLREMNDRGIRNSEDIAAIKGRLGIIESDRGRERHE